MKNAGAHVGIWLIHLLALLPLPVAHALGGVLGRILWWTGSDSARVARINLRICFPEFTPEQVDQMTGDCLVTYGKTCAEMGMAWCWPIPLYRAPVWHPVPALRGHGDLRFWVYVWPPTVQQA